MSLNRFIKQRSDSVVHASPTPVVTLDPFAASSGTSVRGVASEGGGASVGGRASVGGTLF